jgi:predicted ester cyclase
MPVPPTGRRVEMMGCSVSHWMVGRIVEEWNYVDWLGLFRQVGVIPPLG